jgi:hypothetical protein
MAAGKFESKKVGKSNCDSPVSGTPYPSYDYIIRSVTGDDEYPGDACTRYLQVNGKFDNLQVTANINASGTITGSEVSAGGITLTSRKSFDIQHPTKKGWRLRHTCLEGPENGVYFRGRLKNSNIIELPDYWFGLVDAESITISLTQIGCSQDLIVEKIESVKKIFIKSGTNSNIDCYYLINGTRKDGENLISEYEGQTPSDYPGDNSQYSVAGFHYDVRPS